MKNGRKFNKNRKNVGIINERLSDEYQMEIWSGIHEASEELNFNLFSFYCGAIENPPKYPVQANFLYDFVNTNKLDGILFFTAAIANYITPAELADFCTRYNDVPLVSIGQTIPGMHTVLVDNATGMYDVVNHMIRKHYRKKIVFVCGFENNPEAEVRLLTYKKALEDNGILFDPDLVCPGDFTEEAGRDAVISLIEERQKEFDAIIAVDDYTAFGALKELQKRGIKVPKEVTIAGFDDIEEARFITPPLTTVHQPLDELGKKSVYVLADLMEGREIEKNIYLPAEMIVRQSCGCIDQTVFDARTFNEKKPVNQDLMGIDKKGLHHEILETLTTPSVTGTDKRIDILLNSFYQELINKDDLIFINTLDKILLDISHEGGNLLTWQQALNILRKAVNEGINDKDLVLKADDIIQQARVLVGESAERVQAYKRFVAKQQSLVIQRIGDKLLTTFDFDSLVKVIRESLPVINIDLGFLFLFNQKDEEKVNVTLKMAYDTRWPDIAQREGETFAPNEILEFLTEQVEDRHTMMILPLFFDTRIHGFIVLEWYPMDGTYYDELGVLIGTALEGSYLMEDIKERQQAEMDRLKKEMEIAKHIQTALLPTLPTLDNYEMSAGMYPADDVGGDYYDFFVGADGRYWFVIGDVSGHGLTSGLIMLMAQSSISTVIISYPDIKLEDLYSHVNKLLVENIRHRLLSDHFMTLSILALSEDNRFTIIGSHMEQYLYRAKTNTVEEVASKGLWAGILPEISESLEEQDFIMEEGDILLLFTDGLIEAMNSEREQFDTERVKNLIIEHHNESLEDLKMKLLHEVFDFMENQMDDITIMLVRRKN